MISAMRNSIAESFATAPTNIVTGRDARIYNQNGLPRKATKIFV
jgi:hypothetical protein